MLLATSERRSFNSSSARRKYKMFAVLLGNMSSLLPVVEVKYAEEITNTVFSSSVTHFSQVFAKLAQCMN